MGTQGSAVGSIAMNSTVCVHVCVFEPCSSIYVATPWDLLVV